MLAKTVNISNQLNCFIFIQEMAAGLLENLITFFLYFYCFNVNFSSFSLLKVLFFLKAFIFFLI